MATINLESEEGRLEVLERMLTIREFDGMAGDLFADGEIRASSTSTSVRRRSPSAHAPRWMRRITSRVPIADMDTVSRKDWTRTT